ncbi:MAG: metal ABC transporter permease [Chloroflexi bacterium]|nr:metal ABC transporter permease [Chloroflexota bacterium]MQC17160.1 metal ABC transporter permease [Chloroflexota bacterium]
MDAIVDWVLGPYAFTFMQRAALVLVIISVVSGVVGTFVVHKGLAFSGDALAHSTLAGVAVAFVAGMSVSLGALVAAVVTALGIAWTRDRARVSYDTAIGILFVAMFSLGVLVLSTRQSYTPDLFSFVFGDILGIARGDIVNAAILGAGVLVFLAAFSRELLFVAYDPAMARTTGVPARFFEYAILIIVAISVVVALKAIGIILVNAMLIIPPASASMLATNLRAIMALSVVFALTASLGGLHLSFHAGVAASPAIVLMGCAIFLLVLGMSRARRPLRADGALPGIYNE